MTFVLINFDMHDTVHNFIKNMQNKIGVSWKCPTDTGYDRESDI